MPLLCVTRWSIRLQCDWGAVVEYPSGSGEVPFVTDSGRTGETVEVVGGLSKATGHGRRNKRQYVGRVGVG